MYYLGLHHIVNHIVQFARMKFQNLISNLFDSQHVGTTNILNELCCHGKSSFYIPTSLVIWSFQLWVNVI